MGFPSEAITVSKPRVSAGLRQHHPAPHPFAPVHAPIALQAFGSLRQVKQASAFLGGSLLPDRQLTVWRSGDDMRAYMRIGAHLKAMPKLLDWCDEASIVHWEQDDAEVPSWTEADQRMRSESRPSKVRHPGPHHADLIYRAPRLSRAAPIAAKGQAWRRSATEY